MVYTVYHPFMVNLRMVYYCFTNIIIMIITIIIYSLSLSLYLSLSLSVSPHRLHKGEFLIWTHTPNASKWLKDLGNPGTI